MQAPIACDLKSDCFIQQFVDRDPSSGVQDFTCGTLSYDGHKGTDFAVPTLERMREGVAVVAAATGTVTALRDGMPDTGFTPETAKQIENRECGNGVLLAHEDGWQTQYCHFLNGSVQVQKGQVVQAGEPLGLIGQSGRAEFPHVHFEVKKNGKVVDPFAPEASACNATSKTLWKHEIPIRKAGIIAIGVADGIPDYASIKDGTIPKPDRAASALAIYANIFGPRKGDKLHLKLSGPNGFDLSRQVSFQSDQATSFRAVGERRWFFRKWADGTYEGTATLERDGQILDQRRISVDLK